MLQRGPKKLCIAQPVGAHCPRRLAAGGKVGGKRGENSENGGLRGHAGEAAKMPENGVVPRFSGTAGRLSPTDTHLFLIGVLFTFVFCLDYDSVILDTCVYTCMHMHPPLCRRPATRARHAPVQSAAPAVRQSATRDVWKSGISARVEACTFRLPANSGAYRLLNLLHGCGSYACLW